MSQREMKREPNNLPAAVGLIVMIVALLTGLVVGTNCTAGDAAQAFAFLGVPALIGLAGGWAGWHLPIKSPAVRAGFALAAAVATGVCAFLFIALSAIGNCAG